MNLNDLDTFLHVAELGTFSAAAARLGVPKSTVTRRVARLEEALGRALLSRSARSFQLSDDGRALVARCAPALREIAAVASDLGDTSGELRGRIRVTAPIDFGPTEFLAGLIARYALAHPGVQVELEVTNRMVDLADEGFDVALRTHGRALADRDDLVARRLGNVAIGLYASPAYLAANPAISRMDDLADHAVVAHGSARWDRVSAPARVTVNDYGPGAAIVAAGGGVGVLPRFVAAPLIADGRLVLVDIPWETPRLSLSLVWLRSRHLAPRIRAFLDLAIARAATTDWLSATP